MISNIRESIRARFDAFIAKYNRAFPNYIETRYSKRPNYWVSIFQIFILSMGGLVVALFVLLKSKKKAYYFEGDRFAELHELLPANQVVIIGGVREWRYSKSRGYGFHWDGYIRKLFNIFYYAQINISMDILILMIRNIIGRQLVSSNGRLFVFEDTVQIGSALTLSLRDISPVICIIHGSMQKVEPDWDLVPDGELAPYNFVYDDYQAAYLENLGTKCFVMGLPYETPVLKGWKEQIVLVEHSTPDMNTEYYECRGVMKKLYDMLVKMGYEVTYRARPGIDINTLKEIFFSIHTGDKLTILGGEKKVFVGYNSTFLYEAVTLGHVTIGLDDSNFIFKRRFDTNFFISDLQEERVKKVIEDAFLMLRDGSDFRCAPLSDRFHTCLLEVDKDLKSKNKSKPKQANLFNELPR